MDERAGGRDVRKSPFATADKAGMRGRHGAWQEQGAKNGGRRDWEGIEPLGVGGNSGGREVSGVEENPGGGRHGVGGRVESFQDDSTPNGMGRGVESCQDDLTTNRVVGGVELSQYDSILREVEGPRGDETPGALTVSRY